MTIRVVADHGRLNLDGTGDRAGVKHYGNKILHIFFILKIAERHGYKPVIPVDSNIEDIFEYKSGFKELMSQRKIKQIPIIYEEQSCFYAARQQPNLLKKIISCLKGSSELPEKITDVIEVVSLSKKQFYSHMEFLNNLNAKSDFSVIGHYWHYSLMPSASTFSTYLTPKKEILDHLMTKYPTMTNDNAVAVHMRDTDFAAHLRGCFNQGIMLDDQYYMKAIHEVEKVMGGNVEYHLFSDNLDRLVNVFKGKNYTVHNDAAHIDWVAMFAMNKTISSNSSFSWTTCLYNKDLIVQPYCGYNYYESSGPVSFGFHIPNAIMIKRF